MVIVEPPVLMQSYEDVLGSDRRPVWTEISTDRNEFQEGKAGSPEKRIWERAKKMGLKDSLIGSSIGNLMKHAMLVALMKEVVFMKKLFGERIAVQGSCAFSRTKEIMVHVNGLYRQDPNVKDKLNANIENHLFSNSRASKFVNQRRQLIFEADLLSASRRFMDLTSFLQLDGVDQNYRAIEECCSDVVTIDQAKWYPVAFHHTISLLLLTSLCLAVSLIRLTSETGWKCCRYDRVLIRFLRNHFRRHR